ncbi:hypothetical protein Mpt1_c04830 [Candidatus Methanoplasma termitum]|uniref:Uncharacterized protein n=1 Tax=Candidatus Methanoplasma termitum TaxID=1577791 RepID=A0A0A7LB37_9ARCH|nr:hypothetical protein Mpt1_c04830 [Candidatus Methanoplasma termitum]
MHTAAEVTNLKKINKEHTSNTNVKSSPIPTRTYYLGGLLAGILSILLGFVDFWNYSILSGVITIVGGILIIIGAVTIKNGSNVKQAAIFFLIGSILLVASLIGVTLILIPIIGIIGVLLALILLVKK